MAPVGAEKAGSNSGVSAWSGRKMNAAPLPGSYQGDALPDPYAGDRALYTVTAENAARYERRLTTVQKAMLATYPDTDKMNVYPSRRNCTYPDFVYKAAKRNAMVGKPVDGGNGITEAIMASPFPIPSSGIEIVWNHTLRYRGERIARDFNYAVPTVQGDYVPTFTRDEVVFPYSNAQNQRAEDLDNISIYFVAYTSAPARRAGNVVLVHETLNMSKKAAKPGPIARAQGGCGARRTLPMTIQSLMVTAWARQTNMTAITGRPTTMIGWLSASRKNCRSKTIIGSI